mmetsp:Transcript_25458/g.49757  ORF Transcript_25458/g.49757 Transcript_25458/m.49757 type:complete len:149 (+) Transcript_25458:437-883(+)
MALCHAIPLLVGVFCVSPFLPSYLPFSFVCEMWLGLGEVCVSGRFGLCMRLSIQTDGTFFFLFLFIFGSPPIHDVVFSASDIHSYHLPRLCNREELRDLQTCGETSSLTALESFTCSSFLSIGSFAVTPPFPPLPVLHLPVHFDPPGR